MFLLFCIYFLMPRPENTGRGFQLITGHAQGTTYTIKYVSRDEQVSKASIDSIFRSIDLSLSLYVPSSLINTFNREGRVLMDEHMKNVVSAARDCYYSSNGSFDITTAGLSSLWGFGITPKTARPSNEEIKKLLQRTGARLLQIHGDSLKAMVEGLTIDCNGIAQGYTVDVIFAFLRSKGVQQMLVELGGEVRVGGQHPETGYWQVGIESAVAAAGEWRPVNEVIRLTDKAITTSGNYRNYLEHDGKAYSHLIDPHTGEPVDNGIISVTVIADEAMIADAWDNALFVMGVEKAKEVLNGLPQLEAMIVYKDDSGELRKYATPGFRIVD